MVDVDLRLKAGIEGAQETAAQLQGVAAAQAAVSGAVSDGAKPADDAVRKAGDVTAAHRDWFGVLRAINPELAAFAHEVFHGTKVAGELAAQQLDLNTIFKGGLSTIKDNVAALALLGAGGAVV